MNVGALLTKSATTYPNNLAVAYGNLKMNYVQFNGRVNRLANALRRLGIQKGENVAVIQYNCPQTLECIFACFKAGCGAVPINFRLHPNEFAFIVDHSESAAVILSNEFSEPVMSMRDRIPRARHLITLSDAGDEFVDYEKLVAAEGDRFIDVDMDPDQVAWLFYTSGTTGMPKGATLTHRNLLAMTMNFYADICPGFSPDDVVLHAGPLSHGSGLYALPNIGKAAANIIPLSKSFDADLVFRLIQEYRVTNMFVAPTMVRLMIDNPAAGKYDHRSLKSLIYGGGPMLAEDLKKAMGRLGRCLVQLYGQAESPMTITYLPHGEHIVEGTPSQLKRLSSAGFARTDVEIKIFDSNDNVLPSGEIGEIVTRSDLVMKGYWRDSESSAEALRNGWLHTGDIGYIDEKGFLFIMDRSKDMIISGGENIYPREIEEVIIKHPAVREVAVIGVPDPKWGEAVKAVVSVVEGKSITEDELIAFCKDNIAGYKKPKSVDFVDFLPKNNYGKILKRTLRAKYWEGRDRQI
jgi:acyl-CoA synthetase (AMP-forming)/AMP-acid ligase II